jgi:hypothetical protein
MAAIPFVTGRSYAPPDEDIAYRKVEEGLHVPPPPKRSGARVMSLVATYNFIKIVIRVPNLAPSPISLATAHLVSKNLKIIFCTSFKRHIKRTKYILFIELITLSILIKHVV